MKNLISLLKSKPIYFFSLLIFLFTGFLLLLFNVEGIAFISFDAAHPFWLNVFFINYTFMGDGIFAAALIAVYLFYFKKRQEGLALLYAFLLSAGAIQIIKNCLSFSRPTLFFEQGQYLFPTGNVSLSVFSSFPSGHTASAFAIATVMILMVKNKKWQLPVFAAALLTGYSRMYLAQHSFLDILAGSILGCFSGLIAVHLVYHIKRSGFFFRPTHQHETPKVGYPEAARSVVHI